MTKLLATLVSWGPAGLFLAALLDGAGVPVPGGVDVLIVFLASRTGNVLILAGLAILGSVLGNFFLFLVARRGGQVFLDRRSSSRGSKRFRAWFDHYGLLTVFISALVPLPIMPMKIFVLCSGALGAKPATFLAVFLAARIPRYLGLAILGRAMGDNALGFLRANVWYLAAFAAALTVLLIVLIKAADRRKLRAAGQA